MRGAPTMLFALSMFSIGLGACGPRPPEIPVSLPPEAVKQIADDLRPWVDADKLPRAERRSFLQFCRFLAIRRTLDDEMRTRGMTEETAKGISLPLVEYLVQQGKPIEDVLLRLLEARKGLSQQERQKTLCNEDPEVYAAVILWRLQSARAVPVFMELAQDKALQDRGAFIYGLGKLGDSKTLDLLKEIAAKETAPGIRDEATTAIRQIEQRMAAEKK